MAIKSAEVSSGSPAACRRGCLIGFGVVVVLLVLAITSVIVVVRDRLQPPTAPDLAAAMSSPAVLDRHEAAAAALTRLSGQAQKADSWLVAPRRARPARNRYFSARSAARFQCRQPW